METVRIRFYAAARSAAGSSEIEVSPGTLKQILSILSGENAQLANVLLRCSFLVDGTVSHDMESEIIAGSVVDVLPPFAGG